MTDANRPAMAQAQAMMTSFAAGTLIVLGVLLTVLGLFAAGNMLIVLVGLGAVAVGGILGLLDLRAAT
jgi:hypothetical protein